MTGRGLKLKAGPRPDRRTRTRLIRTIVYLVFIGGAVAVTYFIYRHEHPSSHVVANKKQKPSANLATVSDEQKRYQQAINDNLKSGNIQSYEDSELELANQYIGASNYGAAESILQAVQKNVPSDKLSSYYYQTKIQDDVHNQDIVSQKSDLQTLVAMLNSTGQTDEANYYQKQLDKL